MLLTGALPGDGSNGRTRSIEPRRDRGGGSGNGFTRSNGVGTGRVHCPPPAVLCREMDLTETQGQKERV